jgi:hypothetical protein
VAVFPQSLDEVDSITRTVAHDIRSQYTLACKPHNQNAKPEFQSVRVEARALDTGALPSALGADTTAQKLPADRL